MSSSSIAPAVSTAPRPAATRSKTRSYSAATVILEYWHLLSLDAPTVAVVWAWTFARASGAQLHAVNLLPLGIATWLLYVADRLLDGWQPSHADALRERHHFHARHRAAFLWTAVPVCMALLWLVIERMAVAPRMEDLLLAAAAGLYFLCVHLPGLRSGTGIAVPKEAAVAMIFSAACVIPAWSRRPTAHAALLLMWAMFAVLCYLNCAAIETWETERERTARGIGEAAGRHLPKLCVALSLCGILLAVLAKVGDLRGFGGPALTIAGSAILLHLLHQRRSWMKPLHLRAASDAVLLTPLVLVLIRFRP